MFTVYRTNSFTTTHADRYAMPNSPTCKKLTPERSLTATVVNTLVNIYNNFQTSHEGAYTKFLGVVGLSSITLILSIPMNLIEIVTKVALLVITRILSLTCICDWIDDKPLFSNPIAQIPVNIGKATAVSFSTLFVGPYAAFNMLLASKSLDMEEIISYGSFGLTPVFTRCLYKV